MNSPPKHTKTNWRTVTAQKMKLERLNGSPQLSWKVDYGKKNDYLTPSYDALSEQIRKRVKIDYFLMDEADRKAVKFFADTFREQWEASCYESMGTLENFTRTLYEVMNNQKERFYLRTLPPLFSDGQPRVFLEDVGHMLKGMRGARHITADNAVFDQMCNNMTAFKDHAYSTISMDYMRKLLESVDIDKSLIILVDDPIVLCGRRMIYQKGGHFTIRSCTMKPLISVPQATLFLVHSLVCGVNWKKVSREDRNSVAAAIRKISSIQQSNYVEYSFVISIIIEEKKRLSSLYSTKPPDFIFADSDPRDHVELEYYTKVVKEFELMEFENQYDTYNVFMLRVLFVLGWIVNFCDERGYRMLAEMVLDELMNYVPETQQAHFRGKIADLIRSQTEIPNNHTKSQKSQNGNGIITNGDVNSGIVNIEIGPDPVPADPDACTHCEKIQNQFLDIQNQLAAHQQRRCFLVQERESYNVLIDTIHEQQDEIKELQAKLESLEKAKPVIHSRGYATDCRKLDAENQRLADRIKFFENTSSESQRGMNTIAKQNEQTQAMNENLEKQIVELEKQSSHLSEFSTKIVELQTKDQDRIIAELEESIKNLQTKADRQIEIIKDLDKKAELSTREI